MRPISTSTCAPIASPAPCGQAAYYRAHRRGCEGERGPARDRLPAAHAGGGGRWRQQLPARGGRGREVEESLRRVARDVTGAVILDCGHFVPEEQPTAFNRLLLESLRAAVMTFFGCRRRMKCRGIPTKGQPVRSKPSQFSIPVADGRHLRNVPPYRSDLHAKQLVVQLPRHDRRLCEIEGRSRDGCRTISGHAGRPIHRSVRGRWHRRGE